MLPRDVSFILFSAIISARSDTLFQDTDDACHACACHTGIESQDLWHESSAPERRTGGGGQWWTERYQKEFLDAWVIVALVLVTLIFDLVHHSTKHFAEEHGHMELIAHLRKEQHRHVHQMNSRNLWQALHIRFSSELAVLGFLALSVWICNQAGLFEDLAEVSWCCNLTLPTNYADWLHHIEAVHIHLFITMCLYFCVIAINIHVVKKLIARAVETNYAMTNAYQDGSLQVGHQKSFFSHAGKIFDAVSTLREYYFLSLEEFRGKWAYLDEHVTWLHEDLIKDAKMYDLEYEGDVDKVAMPELLRKWFPFDLYIVVNYRHTLDELIEIKWTTWLAISLFLVTQAMIQFAAEADVPVGIFFACLCQVGLIVLGVMNHKMYSKAYRMVHEGETIERSSKEWIHRIQPVTHTAQFLQICIFFTLYELGSTIATKSDWEQYPTWCVMHVLVLLFGGTLESLLMSVLLPRYSMLISSGPYMQEKHVLYFQLIIKAVANARSREEACKTLRSLSVSLDRFDSKVVHVEEERIRESEELGQYPEHITIKAPEEDLCPSQLLTQTSQDEVTEILCDCETYSI